jgi:secreted trypsin-like serine protease
MLRNERGLSGQSRIVGGQDADIGKYPFFVEWDGCGASLVHKGKFSSSNFCQQSFKKEPQLQIGRSVCVHPADDF